MFIIHERAFNAKTRFSYTKKLTCHKQVSLKFDD
ncbi:hypothetical protein BB65665_09449 [Bacillus sp. 916]|nr:hypothetical protein BAMTA208_00095 [Bacillus amyloliquefaciens TA208]AFZ89065.1 hypothetical protein B938_00100 [Bacillus velezensis AS43.3]EJD67839.1 hypothetical protein BB65665_09449 [Bacillus sp. 916]